MKKNKLPNIQDRLFGGLILLLTLSVMISVFYIKDIEKLNNTVKSIVKHPYTVSNGVRDIKLNINAMQRAMKDVALAKNEDQINEAVEQVSEYENKVIEKFELIFELYLGQPKTVENAYQYFINSKPIRERVIQSTKNGKNEEAANIIKKEGEVYLKELMNKIDHLIVFADAKTNEYNQDAFNVQQVVKRKALVFILIALVLGLTTFIWIINSFNKPLNNIINRIKNIPKEQLINKLPEDERNKLVMLDFVFNELNDHKKLMEAKIKERTKELKESQEILVHAINNAPIGIAEVSLDGKFKKANQEFCNLIGYSEKELRNVTFNEITLEEDKNIGLSMIKNILEGVISQGRIEKRYIHKSGNIIHCALTSSLVRDLNNKPLYFFSHIVDITKQKKFQQELVKHQELLETTVEERTKQLDEKANKLADSQKALTYLLEDVNESQEKMKILNVQVIETNKELEAFSYSVSHDLKAPLRAVAGFSQILIDDFSGDMSKDVKRYIGLIKDSADNMGVLINDLLSFSRLGRKSLQISQFNMSDIITRVKSELNPVIQNRKLTFNIGAMPLLNADESLIYHVMMNLISNAVKFTSNTENATVEIGCESKNNKNIYYVRDNGIGFDIKYADKIFDVFQRLHSSNEFPGTGIGLSIVKRIINKHNGKIWVQSEQNIGTTFFFTI